MYLSYFLADLGYELQEWNVLIVTMGWVSLIYRIYAEERMLSQDMRWQAFASSVPYRLVPRIW